MATQEVFFEEFICNESSLDLIKFNQHFTVKIENYLNIKISEVSKEYFYTNFTLDAELVLTTV